MNYKRFFGECADWVLEVNKKAGFYGMQSDLFWRWVTKSSTLICERYGNNELVIRQMLMLVGWIEDIYQKSRSGKQEAAR